MPIGFQSKSDNRCSDGVKVSSQMRKVALFLLKSYKIYISPLIPPACRFEPTCSVYMYQAIQKKGLLRGIFLGIKRLLRCHPFCAGGLDPVP
jgi:putative membrane protein insertion efficiency factor